MRRRDFIAGLGGTAAWPLLARGQQGERMRRVAVLSAASADAGDPANIAAFLQALLQLGWTDGHNLRIDHRAGEGNTERVRKHAAELAAVAPDVIIIVGAASLGRRPGAWRSCSSMSLTRSAPVTLKALRGRGAMQQVLWRLSIV